MSQILSDSFKAQNESDAKSVDFALVISGWPTIYTVAKSDYTRAGDLSEFEDIRAWADLPIEAGAGVKRRPEEGGLTIGEVEASVLDHSEGGTRSLSELLARDARRLAKSVGYWDFHAVHDIPELFADITAASSTIVIEPIGLGLQFPDSGTAYVGLECIQYTGKTLDEVAGTFSLTGCTRGYRLTSPTRHPEGARVYPFMPSLFRRRAFIYKGYQNLGLTDWFPAFGGAIVGAEKRGPSVALRMMSTTFHLHNDAKNVMFKFEKKEPVLAEHILPGDYEIKLDGLVFPEVLIDPSSLSSYVVNVGGHWNVITGVQV